MPRLLRRLLAFLPVVGILPFLVLSNFFIFATPNWLDYEYGKSGFPKAERFDDADRRASAVATIEYVRGNLSLEQLKALGVYNGREIRHLVDVREIVDKVKFFYALLGLSLLIAVVVLAWSPSTRALAARGLSGGALLTIGLLGALGAFAAVGFGAFFTLFHLILFEGDSGFFSYSDSLIQFYPLPFWFDSTMALAVTTVVEALVVGAIGWMWARRSRLRG